MLPEMPRWLGRDQPVSIDPNDRAERAFRDRRQAGPGTCTEAEGVLTSVPGSGRSET